MENSLTARLLAPIDAFPEQSWLPAARRGERWALEHFYTAYHQQVYALCHRMLGRVEDAEDATQAAFVRAFRALPGFRGESGIKTWLYRIAMNEALNLLRKRGTAALSLEEDAVSQEGAPAVAERMAIHAALARVKPERRAILVLRFWEDLSYEEIATVLGVSLPTVKMRLFRAREDFKRWYDSER